MGLRRAVLAAVGLGLLLALAAVVGRGGLTGPSAAAGADAGGPGRVDAIFDTAKGIIPGQVVKIAGARVGKVVDVKLTEDFKARIQLEVDPRFTPFRTDARCDIRPEGLISENFVQCDPGTVESPELRGGGGKAPTVAVGRTSAPVNLTDLFEIWSVPVRDRLRLLINTLGGGVAGRGQDLNDVLRRANPTLGLVHQAVGILDSQKVALQRSIVQAKATSRELARQPEALQAFVDRGASVLTTTAEHRDQLRAGLRELSPTLASTRRTLPALAAFSEQGAPIARRVAAAADPLDGLLDRIPPTARVALPALRALGRTGDRARPNVRSARPVVRRLGAFAGKARPTTALLDRVLTDLRDRGFAENFLSFFYYATAATSRYDGISHIFPANIVGTACAVFATTTDPACDANYTRTAADGVPAKATSGRSGPARPEPAAPVPVPVPVPASASPAAPSAAAPVAPTAPAPPAAKPDRPGLLPQLPELPPGSPVQPETARHLLDFLLGG